jgi:Putative peptidoglycan binding domain
MHPVQTELMNARGRRTPRDPDDWFDEPEPPRRSSSASERIDPDAKTREQTAIEDWLAPEPATRRQGSLRSRPIRTRRILVAVGIAVAFLVIGLALGGVFSGGSKSRENKPLTSQIAPTTTQSPTSALVLPAATVKLGDHGNGVKELQRALRSLGYTVGAIDGVFGASTESALIAFQSAHHLTPDGVFGPATRAALLSARHQG